MLKLYAENETQAFLLQPYCSCLTFTDTIACYTPPHFTFSLDLN